MTPAQTMSATVVVATYNRPVGLRRLLKGLAEQEDATFDVIVVDDGGDEPATLDGTPASLDVQLVRRSNGGPGRARHDGISRATGDVVVVVDDDMIVPPTFVASHLRKHAAGDDVAIGRYRVVGEGTDLLKFQMNTIDEYFDRCEADESAIVPGRLSTGNVSFRRALYEQVGGFDLTLKRCEDRELGFRFALADARFGFATGADTAHADKPVVRSHWLHVGYEYGQADVQIAARHPESTEASPWFALTTMSRPIQLLFTSVVRHPWLVRPLDIVASVGGRVLALVHQGGLSARVSGMSWGMHYFSGVVDASGGPQKATQSLRSFLEH